MEGVRRFGALTFEFATINGIQIFFMQCSVDSMTHMNRAVVLLTRPPIRSAVQWHPPQNPLALRPNTRGARGFFFLARFVR